MVQWRKLSSLLLLPSVILTLPHILWAATSDDVAKIQADLQNRKAQVETINAQLEEYKKKIAEYSKKSASLATDIALLENESAMTELDIAGTQTEIEAQQLEIDLLQNGIQKTDVQLATQQQVLEDLLFALHKQDAQGGPFEMVIGASDFSEVFQAASQLADVNSDIQQALVASQQTRAQLIDQQKNREQELVDLATLQAELQTKVAALETKQNAKEIILVATEDNENEYRKLVSELRQEQQAIAATISDLQDDINAKLAGREGVGDTTSINWPLSGAIITATFHDATYPFRNLWPHSGVDMAIGVGTPVASAAPGYVLQARLGREYGNYIIVGHANGLSTLYAHLSRIDVSVDQYVGRGQVIGLSGGKAGAPGAGFSTGPHLHFEVREQGIPVDPFNYLP